jgi:hypothetical protein
MDGAICLFGCKSPSHSAPFALFMVACHQQHPLIKTLARWRALARACLPGLLRAERGPAGAIAQEKVVPGGAVVALGAHFTPFS